MLISTDDLDRISTLADSLQKMKRFHTLFGEFTGRLEVHLCSTCSVETATIPMSLDVFTSLASALDRDMVKAEEELQTLLTRESTS